MTDSNNPLKSGIGPMRIFLLGFTAFLVICAPFAGESAQYRGWLFVPTVLAPVFAPIMLFVLPLELTMSKLFMTEADAAGKARYRKIILLEGIAFVALILAWLPYLLRLWNAAQID